MSVTPGAGPVSEGQAAQISSALAFFLVVCAGATGRIGVTTGETAALLLGAAGTLGRGLIARLDTVALARPPGFHRMPLVGMRAGRVVGRLLVMLVDSTVGECDSTRARNGGHGEDGGDRQI